MKIIDYVTKQEIGEMEYHHMEPGTKFRIPFSDKSIYFKVMANGIGEIHVKTLTEEEYRACESMTPEPVKEWVEQQADLSQKERDELAEDLENYFVQRRKRIEQEKSCNGSQEETA